MWNVRLTLLAIAIALLTIVTFEQVRGFSFVNYDDYEFVVENPPIAGGVSPASVTWAFTHPYDAAGGPLTWLSHLLDVERAGLDAGSHHTTSLVLHTSTAVLLFLVLAHATHATGRSAVVAALFAVHPLHVESVAWVSARKDVLSGLFWVLGMAAYLRYVRRPRRSAYLVVTAMVVAGLLSKPIVVTLPLVFLLLDLWPTGRLSTRAGLTQHMGTAILNKMPVLAICAAAAMFTLLGQQRIGAVMDTTVLPMSVRLSNAVVSCWVYLGKMVLPIGLVPYYPYRTAIPFLEAAGAALCLLLLTVVAIKLWRCAPYLTVGWLWYLFTLLPVIGLIQAGGHGMADRSTYLPLIGPFIIVSWGGAELLNRFHIRRTLVTATATGLVLAYAAAARVQASYWHDSVALWGHAIAVAPDTARAHANLGVALEAAGEPDRAAEQYKLALALNANDPHSHNNLALLLAKAGRTSDAIEHYRDALRLDPRYTSARLNLANLLDDAGDNDAAIVEYRRLLDATPDNLLARANLAIAFGKTGRIDEALTLMLEVSRRDPTNPQWHYVAGAMWMQKALPQQAMSEFETALRIDPSHQNATEALARLRQK
jgi:tetratricopeptide (TPR) repeat protein